MDSLMFKMVHNLMTCNGKKLTLYRKGRSSKPGLNGNNKSNNNQTSDGGDDGDFINVGGFESDGIKVLEIADGDSLSTNHNNNTTTKSSSTGASATTPTGTATAAATKRYIAMIKAEICRQVRALFKRYGEDVLYSDVVAENIPYQVHSSDAFSIPNGSTQSITFCLDVEYMLVPFSHHAHRDDNNNNNRR